ncbi:MAG: hypothetical protein MMC23_004589 [Stictis urceolatum]|nr:hypothetical protein [Stictis urceolata]
MTGTKPAASTPSASTVRGELTSSKTPLTSNLVASRRAQFERLASAGNKKAEQTNPPAKSSKSAKGKPLDAESPCSPFTEKPTAENKPEQTKALRRTTTNLPSLTPPPAGKSVQSLKAKFERAEQSDSRHKLKDEPSTLCRPSTRNLLTVSARHVSIESKNRPKLTKDEPASAPQDQVDRTDRTDRTDGAEQWTPQTSPDYTLLLASAGRAAQEARSRRHLRPAGSPSPLASRNTANLAHKDTKQQTPQRPISRTLPFLLADQAANEQSTKHSENHFSLTSRHPIDLTRKDTKSSTLALTPDELLAQATGLAAQDARERLLGDLRGAQLVSLRRRNKFYAQVSNQVDHPQLERAESKLRASRALAALSETQSIFPAVAEAENSEAGVSCDKVDIAEKEPEKSKDDPELQFLSARDLSAESRQ